MSSKVSEPAVSAAQRARVVAAGERRWSERQPVNAIGVVGFQTKTATLTCRVLDMSTTGVRFEVDHEDFAVPSDPANRGKPAGFRLTVPALGFEVDCRIAWRRKGQIGARFVSRIRPLPRQFQRRPTFGGPV